MKRRTLVVAPHPDDELLGCGGTLLRRKSEGSELGWLIVTGISEEHGFSREQVEQRDAEIEQVRTGLGVNQLYNLRLPTTRLDTLPMVDLISSFSEVFKDFQPEEVLTPHKGDIHTDHQIVSKAVASCTKWFRHPSIKSVMAYETLSETEFGLEQNETFHPNVFIDIGSFLERKLELLKIYASELSDFPFPRSETNLKVLAQLRGASAGFKAAEAFQLLRERF
jgi:LmbE family N-acetylglucosaminyl deacetylase